MKAMIFAAGLGTRLRPLTDSVPKALVKVGGVPMLARVLDKVRKAGISEAGVIACYLKEQIVSFVRENYPDVEVSVEDGEEPLETGGGIKRARGLLGEGRFLVHNADILSDVDLKWFIGKDRPGSLATLLVTSAPADRYLLFDDGMRLVGWTNVRTGEVKSPYPDFDPSLYRKLSFCGIHILSDEAFALMEDWPRRFSITDFYLAQAAQHPIYGVEAPGLRLIDIGSPEKLAEAEAEISAFL